ncbi:MAG: adaptor protein MecA [Clostridia bacterium]|nr:adaptor protein MecA [Clostridia bacterium]
MFIICHKIKIKHGSFLRTILNEAERQVGFKANNCKILIETFSTIDDYIVFTLTKYRKDIPNQKKLKFKRRYFEQHTRNVIYKFDTFDEFCNFCTYCSTTKLANTSNFAKRTSLYEYNGAYYLAFLSINLNFKYLNFIYTSLSEFSTLYSTSLIFKAELTEHGKVIFATNAIKNGMKYFSNI